MRRAVIGGAVVAVATALVVPAQASAVSQVNTSKLRSAVTVSGILEHERAFQRIANSNGGTRASGTPGYDASAAYVVGKLRAAGYSVSQQPFTFPYFEALAPATLNVVTPTPRTVETSTFDYSGSGSVTGALVPTNDLVLPPTAAPSSTSGCEASDFPTAPAGPAIALIQRGTCTFGVKAANASAAGYEAVIIFNEGQDGRQELLTGTLSAPTSIPAVGVSFADGNALAAQAEAGPITVTVTTSTVSETRSTTNVIADSPQGKRTGETVIVGAHLDSVAEGPGINDNGSGTATILEIAEQMTKLKYTGKLQRQLRFAFWGAEESGLLGSEYYVENLTEAQLTSIYANLNFDMLGSPNYARFVYDGDGTLGTPGPAGSGEIEEIFTSYLDGRGLANEPTRFDGRSDYGPFIANGIPAGGLFSGAEGVKTEAQVPLYGGTAGVAYDKCYHLACDDITNLNTKALNELGDAATHATAVLALSKQGLYPDGSRLPSSQRRAAAPQPEHKGSALVR